MKRRFKIPLSKIRKPCPKCENTQEFTAYSSQCAEDSVEMWVECKCGYDPTLEIPLSRMESPFGGVSHDDIVDCLSIWDELITELNKKHEQAANRV